MPTVSVLIVSYRTPELTLSAARSALRLRRAEVIVVDNASGDRSVELISSLNAERCRVWVNSTNVGFGTAANTAARLATGEVLVFLNSDAVLSREAVQAMVSEVQRYDGRCIAGARLVDAAGNVQRSAGLLPGPFDLAVRACGLNRLGAAIYEWPLIGRLVRSTRLAREYDSALAADEPVTTSMVSMACCAMGRDAFAELGGFDEGFFLYFEDADVCRRALHAGMAVRYVPDAVVSHVGGASSHGDYHFSPVHARSMRQYLEKWWGPRGAALAILLLWLRLIGHAVTFRPGTRRALAALRAALA